MKVIKEPVFAACEGITEPRLLAMKAITEPKPAGLKVIKEPRSVRPEDSDRVKACWA